MIATFELSNEQSGKARCSRGHEFIAWHNNPRHELLFELCLRALKEGFLREAVMNAAAALERCMEYFALAAVSPDLEQQLPGESLPISDALLDEVFKRRCGVRNLWKTQSERQVGGFLVAHTMLCGEVPSWCAQMQGFASLRNKVVHSGYIPGATETRDYCAWVYGAIQDTIATLRSVKKDFVLWPIFENWRTMKAPGSVSQRLLTALQTHSAARTFDEVLADLERSRPWAPLEALYDDALPPKE
jgi:hypothetical protein